MSSTGTSIPATLPVAQIPVLQGPSLSLPYRRWAQSVTTAINSIPDTAVVAELMAEIAALTLQVEAAQTEAAQAAQQAALALSQSDPTLGYLALARLDGSAA